MIVDEIICLIEFRIAFNEYKRKHSDHVIALESVGCFFFWFLKSTYNNDASYNDSTLDSVKEGIQFGEFSIS